MRELHELLRHYAGSEQRYKDLVQSMRNSTLTAFYTPPAIVRALAETLRDAGVVPRRLLDPSAGAGIFPSSFRETADGEVEILSFEKDLLTGQVLSTLAREREQVIIDGFQTIETAYDSYFDVVTSNIPFGDTRIFDASFRKSDDPVRRQALKAVHNYFFIRGLDTLREGGILAFVTSAGVMDAPGNEPVRRYLMEHARLVSAVRLPNNLFTEYAGTEVASDLIVLQKWSEKRELTPDEQRFVSSSEIGNGIYLNDYHRDFKHAIHTTVTHEKSLYGQSALVLHYDGGPERIAERLRGILANDFAARLDTERYTQYLRPLPYSAGANRAADRPEAKSGRGSAIRGATGAWHRCTGSGSTGSGRIAFRQRCRRSDRPPSAGTAAGRAQNGYDRHVRSLHAGKSVHTTGGGSGCPGSNHCAGFGE